MVLQEQETSDGDQALTEMRSVVVPHAAFDVVLHPLPTTVGFTGLALCEFDTSLPMRLNSKIGPQEYQEVILDIQDRINHAIRMGNAIYQPYNVTAWISGCATLGIGFLFVWPLWIIGGKLGTRAMQQQVAELHEWLEEQNEKRWIPRGLQFNVTQNELPVNDGQVQRSASTLFTVRHPMNEHQEEGAVADPSMNVLHARLYHPDRNWSRCWVQ